MNVKVSERWKYIKISNNINILCLNNYSSHSCCVYVQAQKNMCVRQKKSLWIIYDKLHLESFYRYVASDSMIWSIFFIKDEENGTGNVYTDRWLINDVMNLSFLYVFLERATIYAVYYEDCLWN